MKNFLFGTPLLLLVVIMSTGSGGCKDSPIGPVTTLDSAQERWEKENVQDYTFEFRWLCFCTPDYVRPVSLTVRGGVLISGEYTDTGSTLTIEQLDRYQTIDELFEMIEEAVADNAHQITATYNQTYGFPDDVYIDYREMLADEERGFQITNFSR